MGYQSKYKGKEIDEAVSQATDKLPVRMTAAEDNITILEKHKADVGSVPTKLSQLIDDVEIAKVSDIYYRETIDAMVGAKADIENVYYRGTIDAMLGDYATKKQLEEYAAFVSGAILEKHELPKYKFYKHGHSDVVNSNVEGRYLDYPTDDSDRQWAYIGSTSSMASSSGYFTQIEDNFVWMNMCGYDQWTAWKIRIPEDGSFTINADCYRCKNGGITETYILPFTDEIEAEFAPDNAETYGTVSFDGSRERYVRTGAKNFSTLTSIVGAVPIGKAIDTKLDAEGISSTPEDMKIGTATLSAGEYLLLFRAIRNDTNNTLRLRNLTFTKPASIKVGDTVLTEEEVVDIKTHREEIDALNDQMGDVSEALDAIIAIQTEAIGEGGV